MITEDRLRAALQDAASSFEPPADGPQRIIAAAAEPSIRARHRLTVPRPRLLVAAALVAVATLTTLVVTDDSSQPKSPTTASRDVKEHSGQTTVGAASADAVPALEPASSAGTSGGAAAVTHGNSLQTATPLTKVVRKGSVELEVADGRVESAIVRLQAIATGAGGMVSDSKSSEVDNDPTGTVTLRIPADQFDAAVAQVRRLGEVRNASSSATDATAEYTDITARLKSLTATRESLLQVLSSARSIGDILAVRDRITDNQTQIEQLQGRQQVLDNQVALSTLTVSVNERGVSRTQATHRSAWSRAVHGFTSTWSSILAHAGAVIAVLIALALLAAPLYFSGGWIRRAYVRRRA